MHQPKACFDPEKAIHFFDRLYDFETKVVGKHHASFGHDHPATEERSQAMHGAVAEAQQSFDSSKCGGYLGSFNSAAAGHKKTGAFWAKLGF